MKVDIETFVLPRKHQVKPESSWLTPAFSAAIAHKNHFFWLHQHDSSDDNRRLFVSDCYGCRRVLNEVKFLFADRMIHRIASYTFGSRAYW